MSEDWDFYLAKVDHKPASIMVDLGIRKALPKPDYPYMAYLRLRMLNPRDDGLSSQEDFDDLCTFMDSLEPITETPDNIYVGRNTSDGNRDFFYYTKSPITLEKSISKFMKSFPEYKFETGHQEDVEWSTYHNFLYPDSNAHQRIMNRRVCEQLQEHGDDISHPRKIDHWVYFSKRRSLKAFEQFLSDQNFNILKTGREKPLIGKFFINFDRTDIPINIDDVVSEIISTTAPLDGDYDGWGCETVTANTSSA